MPTAGAEKNFKDETMLEPMEAEEDHQEEKAKEKVCENTNTDRRLRICRKHHELGA